MAREVRHDAEGPYVIDREEIAERGGTVAVCQCGLSAEKPYCDGSHRSCADEEDGVLYTYEGDDGGGERRVVDRSE
jgi:CDGSH-type Zn-finger protein